MITETSGYVYAVSGSYTNSHYFLLPDNATETEYAKAVAQASLAHDVNISVGLMQVNSWHIKRMGATIATTIDPCNNILIGSSILMEIVGRVCPSNYDEECLNAALRQYNTGKTQRSSAGDDYVFKVRSNVSKLETVEYRTNKH